MSCRLRIFAAVLMALLSLTHQVQAHDARPLFIQIEQVATQQYRVQWRSPPSVMADQLPFVQMPDSCRVLGPSVGAGVRAKAQGSALFQCANPIGGELLGIDYPLGNPSLSTLIQVRLMSGERHTQILPPEETHWRIPQQENPYQVLAQYGRLGVVHIWQGIDHLLFVACLIVIAGRWRPILITITGFTVAHSLTLILSALQWVKLPVPPVEAVIALSILFLANELVMGRRESLIYRRPVLVASSFGLLHGFGFASVLAEIGLPQTQQPAALLAFNLGVEVGQIAFVAPLVLVLSLLRKLGSRRHGLNAQVQRVIGYMVGTVAGFWFVERLTTFIPPTGIYSLITTTG